MEREKKRSRLAEDGGGGGGERKKERETKGKDEEEEVVVVESPTEDEVDEFFAILRRMQEAVKYFEKSGGKVGRKLTEVLPSREVVDDGKGVGKSGTGVGLDLNTVPEGENL